MIDTRRGSAELDKLTELLEPPSRIGDFQIEGLICKTSTALVYVASGGAFGDRDGVIKLTGAEYAPLLDRELELLLLCASADVRHVVQPVAPELVRLPVDDGLSVVCLLLPFLSGGDLVQWIGEYATRHGHLGPHLALDAGVHVAGVLRELLQLSTPLVHHDIKPQNVLFPAPNAAVADLTLIDFDVAERLPSPLGPGGNAPRDIAESLVQDVHGFGELLFGLATGREPPIEGTPDPRTENATFNTLVVQCLESQVGGPGYLCLADNAFWRDLESAVASNRSNASRSLITRYVRSRPALAGTGAVLLVGLAAAVVIRVFGA